MAIDSIVSMLRLMPGTALAVCAGYEHGAEDALGRLTVRLDTTDEALADELAVMLDCDAEVVRAGSPHRRRGLVFAGRPDTSELGFGAPGSATRWRLPAAPRADSMRFWRALDRWRDGFLKIDAVADDDSMFRMSMSLVGDSAAPISLRAALRDTLPGITFVPADAESEPVVRCDYDEIGQALRTVLPIGGRVPPGFRVAAPAGMPVALLASPNVVGSAEIGDGADVRLGMTRTDAGEAVGVNLSADELLRHIHVVGATGTGKSTMLASMVHQIAHSGHGALVLDPHGTLVDRIVEQLPADAAARCTVVRADDLDNPLPLNPLATDGEAGLATAISDIGQMFYELFDPKQTGIVGPRFEDRVAHALRGLAELRGEQASLLDVPMMLEHKGMRQALAATLVDPRERAWWRNDARNAKSGEYADLVSWCNSKFERFSASPALRAILGSGHDVYDPVGAMDTGEIILVDLAKGQIGQTSSRLLGYLLLNRFWVAAMNRTADRRFHVIVDEAHSVMAGSLVNMLSEGRKFGVAVTVAHQFLGQLDPEVAAALSGNVGTSVTFRANGPHVRSHVEATGGQVDAATLANLPTFTAVVTRTAASLVASRPHTLTVESDGCRCDTAGAGDVRRRARARTANLDLSQLDPDIHYPVDGAPTAAAAQEPKSKFLDEWLAKRQTTQQSAPPSPEPDDESAA
ncbi:type IV secretory system conjugative DNA transfer family protein [Gordonia sp. NPDC062954]|uniref:type IV secretory system conjugative DNA transfer family protein n=1 Tax=Gordonia sp. NPDC062954 TaxID=3364003 RepID=UPI0037CC8920